MGGLVQALAFFPVSFGSVMLITSDTLNDMIKYAVMIIVGLAMFVVGQKMEKKENK